MSVSIKVKQGITGCLVKIEDGTFDEDTIRTLLILSREHVPMDSLIREIAHFVAHTERTQGMFHSKTNSRYAKYKLVIEQTTKLLDTKELREKIKTEDELSDYALSSVSVEKIETKLFKVLYYDGLEDLPETHLQQYTGYTRNEVRTLLDQYYIKKDGYFILKTNQTETLIHALRALPSSKYDPQKEIELNERLNQGEILVRRIKSQMDNIQRVIRGAIFFHSVFETSVFKEEINSAIKDVIKKFGIDEKFLQEIQKKSDEILLCIMTLLHDCTFTFFDKSEARIFLCIYIEHEDNRSEEELYEKGVLALYISGGHGLTFPLFVSDLAIKNYLSIESFESNQLVSSVSKIPWITAKRKNGLLQLTAEE